MSLDLVEPGSLGKPGPIGRAIRFMLGTLCFYGLYELIRVAPLGTDKYSSVRNNEQQDGLYKLMDYLMLPYVEK